MRIDEVPTRLAIIGGGYIAAEFAHVFSALGSEVTVLCTYDRLLRDLDDDLSSALHRGRRSGSGTCGSTSHFASAEQRAGRHPARPPPTARPSTTDLLLVAIGRVPELRPARPGRSAASSCTPTGASWSTSTSARPPTGVWALGDVSSPYQLKHVANHEVRVVAHNLAHPDDLRTTDHRFVPSAVFSHPQLATVGRTEQDLRAAGVRYVSYRAGVRRHRLRLGARGHHQLLQAAGRPGVGPAARRPPARARTRRR